MSLEIEHQGSLNSEKYDPTLVSTVGVDSIYEISGALERLAAFSFDNQRAVILPHNELAPWIIRLSRGKMNDQCIEMKDTRFVMEQTFRRLASPGFEDQRVLVTSENSIGKRMECAKLNAVVAKMERLRYDDQVTFMLI